MTTRSSIRLNKDQQGMASFLIVIFIMIILGLIVLGFAQITRRNQRQSLDRQLSVQAGYAAETGVNDAIKYLQTNPTYSKTDCNDDTSIQPSGQLIPGYNKDLDNTTGVGYTCALIDSSPTTLVKDGLDFNSNTVFPIQEKTGAAINSIRIQWSTNDSSASATGCPGLNSNPAIRSASCKMPMIRADVVPYAGGANRDSLVNSLFSVFAYPNSGGGGSTVYATRAGGYAASALANCGANTCTLDINGLSSTFYYLRLNAIYGTANVTVSINGGNVAMKGAQAIIDVTGKANDVIKRIQVRAAISPTSDVPGFALQTESSQCKRTGVIPNSGSGSTIISPATFGSVCDPTSSSVSEP